MLPDTAATIDGVSRYDQLLSEFRTFFLFCYRYWIPCPPLSLDCIPIRSLVFYSSDDLVFLACTECVLVFLECIVVHLDGMCWKRCLRDAQKAEDPRMGTATLRRKRKTIWRLTEASGRYCHCWMLILPLSDYVPLFRLVFPRWTLFSSSVLNPQNSEFEIEISAEAERASLAARKTGNAASTTTSSAYKKKQEVGSLSANHRNDHV